MAIKILVFFVVIAVVLGGVFMFIHITRIIIESNKPKIEPKKSLNIYFSMFMIPKPTETTNGLMSVKYEYKIK